MMKVKVFKIRIPEEFLYKDQKMLDDFLEANEIMKVETAFVSEERYWSVILYFEDLKPAKNTVKEPKTVKYSAESETLNMDEEKILDALKLWRSEKAKEQNLPTYFIASNKELVSVAKYKPAKKEELLEIKGFGKHKIENYGEEILEILESI
ncbi:ATP-dependent DNA helicase RecQ [Chryseobacterium gleum]|jgi:ribonuclease D|uniref:ATP-dependent DNA helicase RecQ n=2 Tax=Chryseobacterium gleum TaxID=250 RepID=A0A3S4MA37_CHRGE|nr:HRDC domain-containing protein [Chryseobacterium gleum]MCD9615469.1 HRDC domain-containing protein [Chryseobacterium gleum]MCE4066153.1 HRDC domain-containing protein [Chryseobacterium gleum]QQY30253.1 HRDC domain-containing protein [Chryseobacterium gleum]VEE05429.1 ATP-dependent DNA helicase RecQ [Chryseobacterium gleum]